MIQSAQTAALRKPAQLEGAWINDPGAVSLESGVDISSWRTLSADRHLTRLAGTKEPTLFTASTKIHSVADHD